MAMKMKRTSKAKHLNEVASITYDKITDITTITIDNESFLPNILKNYGENLDVKMFINLVDILLNYLEKRHW